MLNWKKYTQNFLAIGDSLNYEEFWKKSSKRSIFSIDAKAISVLNPLFKCLFFFLQIFKILKNSSYKKWANFLFFQKYRIFVYYNFSLLFYVYSFRWEPAGKLYNDNWDECPWHLVPGTNDLLTRITSFFHCINNVFY